MNRQMGGRCMWLAVVMLIGFGPAAMAQQSLRDLAAQEGVAWLAGRWTAVTDEGQEIQVAYRWVAGGYAAAMDFRMGEFVSHGMIYLVPGEEKVVSVGVDSQGNLAKGTWQVDGEKIIARSAATGADGQTREMGIVYTKVGAETMKVAVYGIEYGQLAYEPWATLEFKRQPRQPQRARSNPPAPQTGAMQSLRDLAGQEAVDWLAGRWEAVTDEGEEIQIAYRWVASGHAAATDFRMGELLSHGMIYLVPGQEKVVSVGVDNRGSLAKGTWEVDAGKITVRSTATGSDGETREMGVVYSKVDGRTMKAEVYGIEYGQLAYEPWATLELKRQPRQQRRVRATSAEPSS